jgi:hypothetical protein
VADLPFGRQRCCSNAMSAALIEAHWYEALRLGYAALPQVRLVGPSEPVPLRSLV